MATAKERLTADDPRLGRDRAACRDALAEGQLVVGVPIGPGKSPEAREAARGGKPFSAAFAIAHSACVTGRED